MREFWQVIAASSFSSLLTHILILLGYYVSFPGWGTVWSFIYMHSHMTLVRSVIPLHLSYTHLVLPSIQVPNPLQTSPAHL